MLCTVSAQRRHRSVAMLPLNCVTKFPYTAVLSYCRYHIAVSYITACVRVPCHISVTMLPWCYISEKLCYRYHRPLVVLPCCRVAMLTCCHIVSLLRCHAVLQKSAMSYCCNLSLPGEKWITANYIGRVAHDRWPSATYILTTPTPPVYLLPVICTIPILWCHWMTFQIFQLKWIQHRKYFDRIFWFVSINTG
jgi:hypothetical protein